jgi:DNA replicative helicase MCM subunit Mcm2 (Cdc46/Mcm family)
VDVRLSHVPEIGLMKVENVKGLDVKHLNRFLVIEGTIIRVSKAKNRELESEVSWWQWGAIYTAHSEIEENNRLQFPPSWTNKVERKVNPVWQIGKNIMNK